MECINSFVTNLIEACVEIETGVSLIQVEKLKTLEEAYKSFAESEQKQIVEFLYGNYSNTDLVWLLSVLKDYWKIEEIDRWLLKLLCETDYADIRMDGMLEYQVRRKIKGEYIFKRELRRKNAERYKKIFAGLSYIPRKDRNDKKIIIATSQLLGLRHAPTQVIYSVAYTLQQRMGYEVYIFVFPSNFPIGCDIFWQADIENCLDASEGNFFRMEYKDTSFVCYQVETKYDEYMVNYQKALLLAQTIKPLCVLEMGCNNAFSECFSMLTDTVAMSMDAMYPPVSDAGVLVRLDTPFSDSKTEKYLKDRGQVSVIPKYRLPITLDKMGETTTRVKEGLPQNAFLIAVVGNRLDKEIDEEFLQLLISASKKCKNIGFVFVGEISDKARFLNTELNGKIYFAGYRDNLYSIYRIMDIYLNPKREGGGFSSAMALAAELPVITLPNCDVAYNVGEEFVAADYENMLFDICRYASDPEYMADKRKAAMKQYEKEISKRNEYFVEDLHNQLMQVLNRLKM